MFIKKIFRKHVKKVVAEELAKANLQVVAKDLKIRIRYDDEIYEAKVNIFKDTIDIGNFEKAE